MRMSDSINGNGSPIDDNNGALLRMAYDDLDKAFNKPVLTKDADGFAEALVRLEMKLRLNVLTGRPEIFRFVVYREQVAQPAPYACSAVPFRK